MARTFRRQRQAHAIADLNVTNLIDLGFTLLIIFMIATPLITQEQTTPLELPVTSKQRQEKPDPKQTFQLISVTAQGKFMWGTEPVTLNELQSKLNAVASQSRPPVIRLRADGRVDWQKVATVIDECKKRGLSKLTIDSQSEG